MKIRFPTLIAIAERAIAPLFQSCDYPGQLLAQRESAHEAVERAYKRRMDEVRTEKYMKEKAAMAAATDHDGKTK